MENEFLHIIYNADATLFGKLRYGYRKLASTSSNQPICAACDITHGGLSLSESPAWKQVKKNIEDEFSVRVKQWHRDELRDELRRFVQDEGIRLPTLILGTRNGSFSVVLDRDQLAGCRGEPYTLLQLLREKGLLKQQTSRI